MNLYRKGTNEKVELPQALTTYGGDEVVVSEVAVDAAPGKAGKVMAGGRLMYPGVFNCYIADTPRGGDAANREGAA